MGGSRFQSTVGLLSCLLVTPAFAARAGPALTVDASAGRHAISPYIYGMAYPDKNLAPEIHLPLNRWGGDATTQYNWKIDSTNAGDDWFFMCGGDNPHPIAGAGPDALLLQTRQDGGRALISVPIVDYVNKAVAWDCSFPVSLFGPQQKTNPYLHPLVNGHRTDAGNGKTPDGKNIVLSKEQILRNHTPNTPEFQRGWVQHLTRQFGPANAGGGAVYELDNEPGGWGNTHRDIHPAPGTGHDELVSRSIAYAAMIKSVDPTAVVIGPGDFLNNAQNHGVPGDGATEHAGLGQGDYYLKQMAAYEKTHGKRLLDCYDQHFYPTAQEGQDDDTQLESTRSLWDPTYKEKNWIGQYRGPINLIPGFRASVDKYYPGTKISISEYGWGDVHNPISTLAQADLLGIFARENLYLACLFGPPKAADPVANAFRMYLNYDGRGGHFGDTFVSSESADRGVLALYAAERTKDHAITVMVINKSQEDLDSNLALDGFRAGKQADVYRCSAAARGIKHGQAIRLLERSVHVTYPARSMTLLVIPHG